MKKIMKDIDGRMIKVGDIVRIVGVPDLTGMPPTARKESEPVFRYLVGKYKRVAGVDKMGNAEITFRLKTHGKRIIHWVGIEPYLLRKRRERSSNQSSEANC
jgi:hypothetical protein